MASHTSPAGFMVSGAPPAKTMSTLSFWMRSPVTCAQRLVSDCVSTVQDLDGVLLAVTGDDAVGEGFGPLVFDPVERAREGGQRAGLREHAADLDLPARFSGGRDGGGRARQWSQ